MLTSLFDIYWQGWCPHQVSQQILKSICVFDYWEYRAQQYNIHTAIFVVFISFIQERTEFIYSLWPSLEQALLKYTKIIAFLSFKNTNILIGIEITIHIRLGSILIWVPPEADTEVKICKYIFLFRKSSNFLIATNSVL